MNVKMVFGNSQGLHHLRHRSHEPRMNQTTWDRAAQKQPTHALSLSANSSSSHPSLSMEITPLDVDDPQQPSDSHPRFMPSLANHRSTPATPAEESHHRRRLLSTGTLTPGSSIDWKGTNLTLFSPSTGDTNEVSTSAMAQSEHSTSSTLAFPSTGAPEDSPSRRMSICITPPSTPSVNATLPLGSPTLTYSGLRSSDASGTRRMMLKRKSSNYLRATTSPTNTRVGENGARPQI